MDMLFSPWRSNYMESFKSKDESCSCIFCDAPSKDVTCNSELIVRRSSLTYTILNLYPYNAGHAMVIPYRHVCTFNALTTEELHEIMDECRLVMDAMETVMKPQGFNVGMNIGKAAGAGIDTHLHMHIVPRWLGDVNFMPVLGNVKVISQDLLDIKLKLEEALKGK